MKKHPQADLLAARLANAANKPVTVVPFAPAPDRDPKDPPAMAPEPAEVRAAFDEDPKPKRARRASGKAQSAEEVDDDTKAISLRPRRDLLARYVLAAAERTREVGRVISAQEIMLERLEGGP